MGLWCLQVVLDISTKHYTKIVHQDVEMQRVMIIEKSTGGQKVLVDLRLRACP